MIRQRIRDVRVRAVGRLDLNYQIGPRGTSPEILAWGYSVIRSTEYGTEDQDKAKKSKKAIYTLRSIVEMGYHPSFRPESEWPEGSKQKGKKIKFEEPLEPELGGRLRGIIMNGNGDQLKDQCIRTRLDERPRSETEGQRAPNRPR